jgi:hypothetical protein
MRGKKVKAIRLEMKKMGLDWRVFKTIYKNAKRRALRNER